MDLKYFRNLPKSDLHNHCLLGGRRSVLQRFSGRPMKPFRAGNTIADLNMWIITEFRPFIKLPGAFEKAVEAAFLQARNDGVVRLEMSIDVTFGEKFNIPLSHIISTLAHFHSEVAPHIDFTPELGLPRSISPEKLEKSFDLAADTGFFRSIDLYDDEFAQPVSRFRKIYQKAGELGMKRKAHAGEFGSAESVREAVEMLELDSVQHGIAAASSPEVMRWLADRRVLLNVCPASNIRLGRARSYKTHPVRILFDNGVLTTINTDDVLLFGAGVSEQYLRLLRSGLFHLHELEQIRLNGLAG